MAAINWTNVTDFGQIPGLANTATSGTFWAATLYMLWIIMLLLMIGWGFEVSILVSSFIALIIAILLVYSELIAWYHVVTFTGIILFMFLYIIWSGSKKQ